MEAKQVAQWTAYGIGLVLVYKLAGKLGLIKSSDEINVEHQEAASHWDYSKPTPSGVRLLTAASGKSLSDILYNAHGIFNDDEKAIYSVFRALSAKSQVTSLAYWFKQNYNQDLFYWLKDFLNDSEMAIISKIIESKPNK
jgi:hypothetical protein